MKLLKLGALSAAVLAGAGLLAWWWEHQATYPSTDDAFLSAHILTVAPQIVGAVATVQVSEGSYVKAGSILLTLDNRTTQAAVNAARAQLDLAMQSAGVTGQNVTGMEAGLAAADAMARDAQSKLARAKSLFDSGNITKAALDDAKSALDQATANRDRAASEVAAMKLQLGAKGADNSQVRAAAAVLVQAELALERTVVMSSVSGWVANISVRPGDVVAAGQPLFSIVQDSDWWVDANFRETDLARIRAGQPAEIAIDMYGGHKISGTVSTIGYGSGAVFSLLPPQNATGNWVKVTQRFPVRITLPAAAVADPAFQLRVGASVTATVDTRGMDRTRR
jgi:membrane fusion protein (multidrug efflux system)